MGEWLLFQHLPSAPSLPNHSTHSRPCLLFFHPRHSFTISQSLPIPKPSRCQFLYHCILFYQSWYYPMPILPSLNPSHTHTHTPPTITTTTTTSLSFSPFLLLLWQNKGDHVQQAVVNHLYYSGRFQLADTILEVLHIVVHPSSFSDHGTLICTHALSLSYIPTPPPFPSFFAFLPERGRYGPR